jgi:hypothetical protein
VPRGVQLQLLTGPLTFEAAPVEVVEAVREVQVTVNAGQRSGFQIKLALASGSALEAMLADRALDPPARVLLVLHVDGTPTVLSDGVITRHDVTASNDPGGSTLSLTGVDVGQMMDLIDLTGLPMPMPAEAQAAVLLAPFAAYGVVPVILPSVMVFARNPVEGIGVVQGTTWAHLTRLAEEVGYVLYLEPGPVPGMNVAYWGPELRLGDVQPALTVNSDAESNVESMSFSFDGTGKTVYFLTAFPPQVRVPIPLPVPDVSPLSPPLGQKYPVPLSYKRLTVDRHADRPSVGAARTDVAKAVMQGLAKAAQSSMVITGSGSLDVGRYGSLLQCRRLVGVRGAGTAYDGTYVVRSVTTSVKQGEVKQRFTLARNLQVSMEGRVRV